MNPRHTTPVALAPLVLVALALAAGALSLTAASSFAGVPSARTVPVLDVTSQRDIRNLIPLTASCLRTPCVGPDTGISFAGVSVRDIDACLPRSRRTLTLRLAAEPVAMEVATLRTSDGVPVAATPTRVRKLQPSRNRYRLRLPNLKRADLGVVFKIAYARTPAGGAFGDEYYLRLKKRC